MSKSKPESCISIPEDDKSVRKKIMKALSGGRETLEEHKKLGAEVEKCMIFELLKQHLVEDDKELERIYQEYKSGRMSAGEIKQLASEKMILFMNDFNKKLQKAKSQVDKIRFVTF